MKMKSFIILILCTLMMASCTSYKNVPYLQNPEVVNSYKEVLPMYDAKIMPKDLLTITVNTTDPEAAAPFNMTVQTAQNLATFNKIHPPKIPSHKNSTDIHKHKQNAM